MSLKLSVSRNGLRGSRRAIVHPLAIGIIVVALVGVGALSLAPSNSCNISATVSMSETQFILGSYYSVNGVTAQTTGYAPLLDWGAASFVLPGLTASYDLAVTIAGHTVHKDESKLLPTLSVGSNAVTDMVTVGYIPQGTQTVTAVLTVNGAQQGTATTTIDVGCWG